MLYNNQPNTLEMTKAFLHLILTIIACSFALYSIIQFEDVLSQLILVIHLHSAFVLLNMVTMVVVFIIFNTSYYAFVSYQRIKMLVFAIVFLFLGLVNISMILIRLQMKGIDFNGIPIVLSNGYLALGNVFFVVGILISAFIPFEMKLNAKNHSLIRLIPMLGFVTFIAIIFPFNYYISIVDPIVLEQLINKVYLSLLAVTIIVNLYLFIRNNNGYLIRICSGMVFLFTAQLVHIFGMHNTGVSQLGGQLLTLCGFAVMFFAVFKFNVGLPLQDLKNAERQIKLYADNLERIIEKRTSEVRKANEKFIHELDYAKSIQQSLLPAKKPVFREVQFVSEYFPCERLSGDFFDIYRIDDDNIGMYVLDVSGHGISAALMTMFCNNVIKSTEKLIKRYRGLKPHRNLLHFYEEFNKMNFPDEMHMVIFYASYNMSTSVLTYCSGGMNCHPIIVRENGQLEYLDQSKGFPICRVADFYVPVYASAHVKLEKNDLVVFYTDGLVDKDKNKCLSDHDFEEILIKNSQNSLRNLNAEITKTISANLHQIDDDITYFIMKINKGDKNEGSLGVEGVGSD